LPAISSELIAGFKAFAFGHDAPSWNEIALGTDAGGILTQLC